MKQESAIVRRIAQKVRETYPTSYVRKLSDRFTRGLSDLMIVWTVSGRLCILFAEVKTATGKPTPIQMEEGKEIARMGSSFARWVVARSADDVLATMEEMSR